MKPIAFIAGPMTGEDNFGYGAFDEAAETLRLIGLTVDNPADHFDRQQDLPYQRYLRETIKSVTNCDLVVALPGWMTSPGALLEVAVATALAIPVRNYHPEMGVGLPAVYPGGDWPTSYGVRNTLMDVLDCWGLNQSLPVFLEAPPSNTFMALSEGVERPAQPVEPITTWAEAETDLLLSVDKIVNSDRNRTYGAPHYHHRATAKMWSAFLTRSNGEKEVVVRPQDISSLMILDKVSRMGGGDKVDSLTDVLGYGLVHAKVRAAMERGEA